MVFSRSHIMNRALYSIHTCRNNKRGFTLIELLVVIAMIGVIAGIALVSLSSVRDKARTSRVKTEMKTLVNAFTLAQGGRPGTMLQVTGSSCSDCSCRIGGLPGVSDSHACMVAWQNVLSRVALYQNEYGIAAFKRDPWGSPYLLDENEQEAGAADCRYDSFRSAGPDGAGYSADDVIVSVPHIACP